MLPKANRFSFKSRIPRKLHSAPFFVVRYDKNDKQLLECAVVVGKKVDKSSVVRNRIKRQILALIHDQLDKKTSSMLVIYVKKQINGVEKEVWQNSLQAFFDTLK